MADENNESRADNQDEDDDEDEDAVKIEHRSNQGGSLPYLPPQWPTPRGHDDARPWRPCCITGMQMEPRGIMRQSATGLEEYSDYYWLYDIAIVQSENVLMLQTTCCERCSQMISHIFKHAPEVCKSLRCWL